MRATMVLNGLGLMAAVGFAGTVLSRAYTPLWAMLGGALFFIGLCQPLVAEYLLLGSGFKEVEGGYLESHRRDRGMGPKVEILGPDRPPGVAFAGKGASSRADVVLFALGCGLILFDVAQWWGQRPPPPETPGLITNF